MIARIDARSRSSRRKVRYAVVGLGHIAQVAVLPAFAHASENSELVALVSDHPGKLRALGRRYDVQGTYSYDEYEVCLASGKIDAVYIALPNDLHRDYAERAAQAGVHVLCEKPMALTENECDSMIRIAEANRVKLMIAYRLHFEKANLAAIEIARSGRIGEPRYFSSDFSMQVRERNIRVKRERGGGPLYDIGIYCINAARYLFRDEPTEVLAPAIRIGQKRFQEVEESVAAILRFPGERVASFVCSFGAADVAEYRIVGTEGNLRVEPAYEYAFGLKHHLTVGDKTRTTAFPKRDQFAPELIHFSKCVLEDREPEPSGTEGLADVRIIDAIHRSIDRGASVELEPWKLSRRPSKGQEISRPPVRKPRLVGVRSGHRE